MKDTITINQLDAGNSELIQQLADWYFEEWEIPKQLTIERLSDQPNDDIYFQLVLYVNREPVGTGCVRNQPNILNVHPHLKQYTPTVSMLCVKQNHRGQGFGAMLLKQTEHEAKQLGLDKLYLYTFTAESLYTRSGWQVIDRVWYKDHDTVVMEKKIQYRNPKPETS